MGDPTYLPTYHIEHEHGQHSRHGHGLPYQAGQPGQGTRGEQGQVSVGGVAARHEASRAGDWPTEVRGQRRATAVRRNGRRHARDRLLLLHSPGPAPGRRGHGRGRSSRGRDGWDYLAQPAGGEVGLEAGAVGDSGCEFPRIDHRPLIAICRSCREESSVSLQATRKLARLATLAGGCHLIRKNMY